MKVVFADDDVQFIAAMQREMQRRGLDATEVCAKINTDLRCLMHVAQPPAPTQTSDMKLTARQKEVLAFLALGKPNKHIARELNIAERTVKMHISALLGRVNANNRTHLLVLAAARGLL